MHIPAVRLGLWCLYCAASVAAPLVVEAGGGTFSSSWQGSAAEGLAGIRRRRSGGYPPQTVWQGSAAEGLAGVRRGGIGSDLPGGIGSDLPGLNAQGELMSARTLSRLFPAPGCGALRWRRQ